MKKAQNAKERARKKRRLKSIGEGKQILISLERCEAASRKTQDRKLPISLISAIRQEREQIPALVKEGKRILASELAKERTGTSNTK